MTHTYLAAILAGAAPIAVFHAPAAQAQEIDRSYDIAAQSLADALRQYSRTSGREVIAPATLVAGKYSQGARGTLTADAALARILRGTGLNVELVDGTLVVREGNGIVAQAGSTDDLAADGSEEAIIVTGSRIRGAGPTGSPVLTIDREAIGKTGYSTVQQLVQSLPQNFGGGPTETTLGATTRNGAGSDATYGSSINLRGLGASSTLVLIDNTRPALGGIGGVFADISLIPMNAIERIEVMTDGASAIYGADAVGGVVNVRLRNSFEGAETVLRAGTADGDMSEVQLGQLLGKRWDGVHVVLAYQFSERGALAAGKRAFAREDLRVFGGPDFRSIYAVPGTITAANGQLFGIPAGQDGRNLDATDLLPGVQNRRDARAESELLPRQRVHSLYAAGAFDIADRLTFRLSALASDRRYRKVGIGDFLQPTDVPVSNPFYVDPIGTNQPVQVAYNFVNDLGAQLDAGRVRALTTSAELEQRFGSWRVQLGGTYGRQRGTAETLNVANRARLRAALADSDPATAFNLFGNGSANNPATIATIRGSYATVDDFESMSAVLRADGSLFRLPGGEMRLAVGAEYRREKYQYETTNDISFAAPLTEPLAGLPGPRHVKSAYAELFVPIIGADNAVSGFRKLDLSLAGRIEDYNQFGRTTNPKFGVRWEPLEGIALRGSYGTSFRAPSFDELIGPAVSLYTTFVSPDPASPTGASNVLALFGYAPNIGPEEATSWTAGFDLAPPSLPGLKASLTYYDVNYKNRIGTASEDFLRFLSDREAFGGVIIDNPPLSLVQSYFDAPTFSNPFGLAPTDIVAILDGQVRNLSAVRQRGLDFDVGYAPAFAGGVLDLGIAGSHIFSIDRQLTPGAPATDVVGTYGNPAKWRLRGRFGWSSARGFSVNAFANHIDGYINQVVTPVEQVSSWTTVDLTLSQRIGSGEGDRGLNLALSIVNLFDQAPPYLTNRSNTSALGYDPEKANPLGRMISLQASVRW